MSGPRTSGRTARIQHPCVYGIGCTIMPGDFYVEEAYPPKTLTPDEVPNSGTAWHYERYHPECRARYEAGDWRFKR